jgi:glycosyltransferase involved in cell wall biosynthesis
MKNYVSMKYKIGIIGARSMPSKYGGFESFVEGFISYLKQNTDLNYDIIFIGEPSDDFDAQKEFTSNVNWLEYREVDTVKSRNPLGYYYKSLKLANDCDTVLVLGLAGGFFFPFFKNRIVVNVDGLEWKRKKFSFSQRLLLWVLGITSINFSNRVILDSVALSKYAKKLNVLRTPTTVIEYTSRYELVYSITSDKLSAKKNKNFIVVCRLVPENSIDTIIEAWCSFEKTHPDWTLTIVGDYKNTKWEELTKVPNQINWVGSIYSLSKLKRLLFDSFAYIHGHTVGGTNPSLVEAMSLGIIPLCHDNEFNQITTKNTGFFFRDSGELSESMSTLVNENEEVVFSIRDQVFTCYKNNYSANVIYNKYIDNLCDE